MLKRTLLAAFAVCCFGLFAAAQAADPLVLQTKWLADAQSAGFYVAQAKGFYKQAGLDVTILPGGPDITPSEVLASGKADVAVDWMPSALAVRDKGAPLVNIAQMPQHSGLQLACRRDSGIRRPATSKGKRLGSGTPATSIRSRLDGETRLSDRGAKPGCNCRAAGRRRRIADRKTRPIASRR